MSYDNEPRGFLSFYNNDYKKEGKHPDFKGNILIPFEMINEASEDPDSIVELKNGTKCVKFNVAGWVAPNEDEAVKEKKPIVNGQISKFKKYTKKNETENQAPEKKQGLKKKLT